MESFFNRVVSYVVYRWNQRIELKQEYHAPLLELMRLLKPMHARGQRKTRVGADRDGGYVMLDDFDGIDAALSLGIGPDVSWDLALAKRGIPVLQYDHTIAAPPGRHPLFHFEPKRVVSQTASNGEITLADLIQQQAGKQLLLKMDIEGDEWKVLAELPPGLLNNCRQIVMELHHFLSIDNQAWHDQARAALEAIARDFAVVHIHGNNLSKHIVLDGFELPDSLEVTFANKRFYQFEPTQEFFPTSEDRKNNPYFSDFRLGQFRFQSDDTAA